ncbi:class D sortase [Bacillus cereus]|uniref:class D sortase n=1 Tax=Bacillus cereus TaxID=1396 RepID=UPI001D0CFBF4|nr:class D sortase [Bacillus cereus]
MRKLGLLIMAIGVGCIGYAAYDLYSYKLDEDRTLNQAEKLLEEAKKHPQHNKKDNLHNSTDKNVANAKNSGEIKSNGKEQPSVNDEDSDSSPNKYHFNTNDAIGILTIPKIGAKLPIVEGTNPKDLKKGVGHHSTTVLPGQQDMVLLSGHRDTVFRKMGQLKNGDRFTVELPYGTYTYEMRDHKIVDADDTSIIKSTAPDEVLVISTCYPFHYLGDAPQRYVIYAYPV